MFARIHEITIKAVQRRIRLKYLEHKVRVFYLEIGNENMLVIGKNIKKMSLY